MSETKSSRLEKHPNNQLNKRKTSYQASKMRKMEKSKWESKYEEKYLKSSMWPFNIHNQYIHHFKNQKNMKKNPGKRN